MNILMLVGSYRKNGNTAQVCDLIRAHLEEIARQQNVPLEIETIYLGHQRLEPCRGCRACFDRGEEKCPLKDDIPTIRGKMRAADGLLVAAPIYVDDVNGITKNWIDRMAHACHRPEFAGKMAYSVVTVGSTRCKHALDTMNMALRTWGYHIAGQAGFKTGALMKAEAMQAQNSEKARRIAQAFFQALHTRAHTRPSFLSLMIFKIQQTTWRKELRNQDTIDYQYWKNQGWLDPRRVFYIPIQTHPLVVSLARLTGAVIGRFVA